MKHYLTIEIEIMDAANADKIANVHKLGNHPYPPKVASCIEFQYATFSQAQRAYNNVKSIIYDFAKGLLEQRCVWVDGLPPEKLTVLVHTIGSEYQSKQVLELLAVGI